MKITTEDLGDRQVMLTIEVDEERIESALRGVARRISRQYSIPGFRRGRAPYHIVLQRFGREALLREVLDDLGQEVYQEAIEGESLEPYAMGSLEDLQLDPLVLKLRVPLQPTVDLGEYRELRVEPPLVAVDEDKVEAELERLRYAHAIVEPVDDRPAQMGDIVTLDVSADVGDASYVDQEAYDMPLEAEAETFAPGFGAQIVGMAAGEEKSFTLTLPDDGDLDEQWAGQEATFNVTLRDVRSRVLPELDDDLARTVGDFDTLEELRQGIRRQFEEREQRQADSEYVEEVLQALVAGAEIEYPPDLIEDQIDRMLQDVERRLEEQGTSFDDYLKLSGQTEEGTRESLRPRAEHIIQRSLALSEVTLQEKLSLKGGEIDQYIALLSAGWGERADEAQQLLSSPEGLRSIANNLLTDKAIERLVAIARGEAPPLEEPDEELAEEPEAAPAEEGAEVPEPFELVEETPSMEASPEPLEEPAVAQAEVEEPEPGPEAAPVEEEADKEL